MGRHRPVRRVRWPALLSGLPGGRFHRQRLPLRCPRSTPRPHARTGMPRQRLPRTPCLPRGAGVCATTGARAVFDGYVCGGDARRRVARGATQALNPSITAAQPTRYAPATSHPRLSSPIDPEAAVHSVARPAPFCHIKSHSWINPHSFAIFTNAWRRSSSSNCAATRRV
jgi:hypothetical protein